MCVERIHRVMMAIVLLIALYFMSVWSVVGLILQGFVIVMLLIWSATGFCPATTILGKFLPKCPQ
jgi:hypothetical protein